MSSSSQESYENFQNYSGIVGINAIYDSGTKLSNIEIIWAQDLPDPEPINFAEIENLDDLELNLEVNFQKSAPEFSPESSSNSSFEYNERKRSCDQSHEIQPSKKTKTTIVYEENIDEKIDITENIKEEFPTSTSQNSQNIETENNDLGTIHKPSRQKFDLLNPSKLA